jgi:hypothetical protein
VTDLFWMPEHHDLEEFNVFLRPDITAWCRCVLVLGGGVGGEEDQTKFPNVRPFDILAPREQTKRAPGERKITALY